MRQKIPDTNEYSSSFTLFSVFTIIFVRSLSLTLLVLDICFREITFQIQFHGINVLKRSRLRQIEAFYSSQEALK